MTLPARYALFALVLLASAAVVALGAVRIRRLDSRVQVALASGWLALHAAAFLYRAGGAWVSDLLVLGSAVGAAALLARTVRAPGSLVAFAVTASVVDVVSFSSGPTRWLLDSESSSVSEALRYLAVSIPYDGATIPVVGIGDLLIFGTLFLGLTGQGHRWWSAWGALALGLLVALGVGLLRGGAFGIPFMAAGAIALVYGSHREVRG